MTQSRAARPAPVRTLWCVPALVAFALGAAGAALLPAPVDALTLQPARFTREQMEGMEVEAGSRFRVVYGTRDPATSAQLRARAMAVARRVLGGDTTRVEADVDATEAEMAAGPVVLVGSARENTWTERLAPALPVRFTASGFRWQGTAYEKPGDAISLSYFSPLAPRHFLLLLAANAGASSARHGMLWGGDDWRITRGGELVRSGRFAQSAAKPWGYDAALDRDREAERASYGAGLVATGSGALVVRAPAGTAMAADAARRGTALLLRMDAMGLPAPARSRVTLTLYRSLEAKGLLARNTRPEHLEGGDSHAALPFGREQLDLWSVAGARLMALGASRESRFVESAGAWLSGRLEGEALEAAVSRVYYARLLPSAAEAATKSERFRSPLIWIPARALLARAVWESALTPARRASLLALVRRDPPGTLDSLCVAAGVKPALVTSRYRALADSLARAGRAGAVLRRPRAWKPSDGFQRGVCVAHSVNLEGGYLSARCAAQLRLLREAGANWVSITPFGYLPDATQPVLVSSADGGPDEESDEAVCEAAARARALGLRVWLKPHLWTRVWVGELRFGPAGWNEFFDRYRELALHWALLAERERMDGFCVGHELSSSTARAPERWRALIADVRGAYSGTLTYDANWDEVARVDFWDALDVIGVSFYSPLASAPTRDAAVLRAGAAKALAALEPLARKFGRPVLLAELGYAATPNAPVRPWEESREAPDLEAQRACYRAVVDALGPCDWVAGAFWWKWFSSADVASGPGDASFSPRGKPAEAVMRAAMKGWEGRAVKVGVR